MNEIPIAVSHYPPFIPILKALAPQGYRFWSPTGQWAKTLIDLDLPAQPLGSLIERPQLNLSDIAYIDAARILQAGMVPISQNGKGPTLSDPAYQFLAEKAPAFLYPRLFDLCAMVRSLDIARPRLVLVHNDVETQTRAMCLWAKIRNVPSLHVPHAIYQDVNRGGPGTDVHDLITASWLASAGKVQSDWYQLRGFPDDRIIETGRPALDGWARNEKGLDKTRARRQLRLPQSARVACYTSTWTQITNRLGANEQWVEAYHSFLFACRDLGLEALIKCHPVGGQQNWQWHVQEAQRIGIECTVSPHHLESCLFASDLLVAFGGSNTIIEGSFIPGLRLLSTHGYEGEPAVGRVPLDRDGMKDVIEVALKMEPPDTSGLKTRWIGEADGQAGGRVGQLITELTQG